MKLWFISQDINNDYDTYSDAVVAAETEEDARNIHPAGDDAKWQGSDCWTSPVLVTVEYIGEAKPDTKSCVICSSFHAG